MTPSRGGPSPTPGTAAFPTPGMLVVGTAVLAISVAAFFRVPLLPTVGSDLGMSVGQLGLITTLFGVGRLATDIPAGRLADRVPPLWSLGIAGLLLAVGSVVFATAGTAAGVIGAGFVLGIASATANTTGMTYFSSAAPLERRGMAMAGFSAALLGGQALGPAIGGMIGGGWGWRVAVGAAAAIGVAVAAAGATAYRRGLADPLAGAGSGLRAVDGPAAPSRSAPALQRLLLYAVGFTSFLMLGSMPQTLVPIIGAERHGLTPGGIGLALGVGGAARLVGALAGGRLSDRISRKASLVPGLLLGSIGVGILAFDLGRAGWLTAIVLLSLGSYGISVAATMLADHAGGAGVGRHLGAFRFAGDVGLITGPAVSAWLYEHVGASAAVLAVACPLLAVAVSSAALLQETRWTGHPTTRAATASRGDQDG